jgi:hypothetical protein
MSDLDLQLQDHLDTLQHIGDRDAQLEILLHIYMEGFKRGEAAGKCAVIATRLSRFSPQNRHQ